MRYTVTIMMLLEEVGVRHFVQPRRTKGLIDWTEPHKSKSVRCPYCADGFDFRRMVRQGSGDWYVCGGCGHLSLPSSPFYRCICRKCSGIERKWGIHPLPVIIHKRSLIHQLHTRLRYLSRLLVATTYSRH